MPVAFTYVLGNTCPIDKTTPRAEAGDTAVVYAVNNTLPNNQAEVWIFEDADYAAAIGAHVKAVEDGRMGEQLGAARFAELRNAARRKLEACTVRSFNISFASQYRDLLLMENVDAIVGTRCDVTGRVIVGDATTTIAAEGTIGVVASLHCLGGHGKHHDLVQAYRFVALAIEQVD